MWFGQALEKAGIERRMGPALFTTFRAAGLPAPRLMVEGFAEGGPGAPAWAWANVLAAAIPLMESWEWPRGRGGPGHAGGPAAGAAAGDGCVIGPPMTGAWTALPAT